jgi:hypothetical protein
MFSRFAEAAPHAAAAALIDLGRQFDAAAATDDKADAEVGQMGDRGPREDRR